MRFLNAHWIVVWTWNVEELTYVFLFFFWFTYFPRLWILKIFHKIFQYPFYWNLLETSAGKYSSFILKMNLFVMTPFITLVCKMKTPEMIQIYHYHIALVISKRFFLMHFFKYLKQSHHVAILHDILHQ